MPLDTTFCPWKQQLISHHSIISLLLTVYWGVLICSCYRKRWYKIAKICKQHKVKILYKKNSYFCFFVFLFTRGSPLPLMDPPLKCQSGKLICTKHEIPKKHIKMSCHPIRCYLAHIKSKFDIFLFSSSVFRRQMFVWQTMPRTKHRMCWRSLRL